LEFEDKLIEVKTKMTEISFTYFRFYSLFDNTYVPFDNLKNMTSELVEVKNIVDQQLSVHFDKFSRHLEFLTYCLVYYKYFDEYTETLAIVEKKINTFV
jgi:radical SAM superfamily enzyme